MHVKLLAVQRLIEEEGIFCREPIINTNAWYKSLKDDQLQLVQEIYTNLGGSSDFKRILPTTEGLDIEDTLCFLSHEHSFNRYRLITYRSELYDEIPAISSYKSYCKTYEKECIKSAAAARMWSHKQAIQHFGAGSEPGELYGAGAPGWKYRAMQEFILDCYLIAKGYPYVQLTVYDKIMFGGKLQKLGNVLLLRNPDTEAAVKKFLLRKISAK